MFPRRMTFYSKVSQHVIVWHSKLVFAKVTGVIIIVMSAITVFRYQGFFHGKIMASYSLVR